MNTDTALPELELHLFYGNCPACGRRFRNGMFQLLAYSMHYAQKHLGIRVFRDPRRD